MRRRKMPDTHSDRFDVEPGHMDAAADDQALQEKRQGYDRGGNKHANFAAIPAPHNGREDDDTA